MKCPDMPKMDCTSDYCIKHRACYSRAVETGNYSIRDDPEGASISKFHTQKDMPFSRGDQN